MEFGLSEREKTGRGQSDVPEVEVQKDRYAVGLELRSGRRKKNGLDNKSEVSLPVPKERDWEGDSSVTVFLVQPDMGFCLLH